MNRKLQEGLQHHTIMKIRKFRNREDFENNKPYAKSVIKGNLLLKTGINYLWKVFCGGKAGGENFFDNSNSYIGVGNDNTAANANQTDLQGLAAYKGMEATYPQYGSNEKVVFKSIFNETEGNMDWEEFCVTNYDHTSGSSGVVLNRKVQSEGTKTSGEVWEIYITITLS